MSFVLRPVRALVALALVASLGGCERADSRLEKLTVGIAKDSVLKLMGTAPQRLDPYLVGGQYIEAMYFPRAGRADSVADRKTTPVIVISGQLRGWGWGYWDSAAAANNIQVAAKQQ